jgi:hypothetical protein
MTANSLPLGRWKSNSRKISIGFPGELEASLVREFIAKGKIVSKVEPCTPDRTDAGYWYMVHYWESC